MEVSVLVFWDVGRVCDQGKLYYFSGLFAGPLLKDALTLHPELNESQGVITVQRQFKTFFMV